MKKYGVILNIKVNGIDKIYNLKIVSSSVASVEAMALTQTGNAGATDYTITITELGDVEVGE